MYTASSMYGAPAPAMPSAGVAAPTAPMATSGVATGWRRIVDPRNPLFWFGAVLAVTTGAAAFAGSVRVGKATAKVSVG